MVDKPGPKHVVIVGGGFAGIGCARKLASQKEVRVTLIDKNNYHQFQPLLYQVATSLLAPDDVAASLRKLFRHSPNVDVKLAEVTTVDPTAKTVTTSSGEVYQGDYLVLAAGSQPNFFRTPGAEEYSFPLYSLDDAERLRSRILKVFEDADREPKLIDQGALNFVIVGAGPTGTEMAGALAEMINNTMTVEYQDLAVTAAKVYLVDHGHAVLGPFSEKAHEYAASMLKRDGVQIRLGVSVQEVTPDHVLLSDGTTIKTRLVIWGGGLMAAPLASKVGLPQGRGGRISVRPDLTVEGFPGVFVLGDFANIPSPDGRTQPQLGSVALQAGRWTAQRILYEIKNVSYWPFNYHDKGFMAMIGHGAAIAEIGEHRHELHGPVAFATWLGVHAYLMSGVRNRIDAFIEWAWDYFSASRGPQELDRTDAARIDWSEDEDIDEEPEAGEEEIS
jgi:NADH:ubiquinone reductase (H+-translocating)